ncbi:MULTISPECIES: hypothetical protein [unclassified Providencia]|uniref:hypothetical protein n=1 Tax=unclassified Providencia TaxID=2633465 RepID=UPI002349FB37|nr:MULTISPECIES: hypothetical protein [unclassified Providencia]
MKRVGILLTALVVLSGCQTSNSTLVYECNIDQSINQISRDRNGFFAFPTAAPTVKVFSYNGAFNIRDFEAGEYAGYKLEKSQQQQQIKTVKDFKVIVNKGDYYHDSGKIIEIFSPKQKTISLFLIDQKTGKTDSLQFLTDCEKKYIEIKNRPQHDDHGSSPEYDKNNPVVNG